MRFFAFKSDFHSDPPPGQKRGFSLDASTSVIKQKRHFFDCLRSLGELIALDEKLTREELKSIFQKPDAIFTVVHGGIAPPAWKWNALPKRILAHSLGSFFYPDLLYDTIINSSLNTISLVTTDWQRQRLKNHLGQAAPRMAVFTPQLDQANFYPPTPRQRLIARNKFGIKDKEVHLVYAGRWLATKGICQLIRTLNLWPLAKIKVSLVGSFNPDFPITQSAASHFTFADYFKREFLLTPQGRQIRLLKAREAKGLREIFWSADLFVYPSLHEDENFGMAPREAALCGVPCAVTDFCGLHPLTEYTPWGGIATYPAFGGSRYSLQQLRDLLAQAVKRKEGVAQECRMRVKQECQPQSAKSNLKRAIDDLLKTPLEKPLKMKAAEKAGRFKLFRYADPKVVQAFLEKKEKIPEGALVDGTGMEIKGFPYRKLQQAVQGFYTTIDRTPKVKKGQRFRGFFRLAAWKEEQALVEFGFPGPRIKRYRNQEWQALISCLKLEKPAEVTFAPRKKEEIALAQELVDLGYLVSDFY
jgi:glycosyltransferase involved in cell wall biosynthesis